MPDTDNSGMGQNSGFYREFLVEKAEILRHKWIESEKAGYDIGFERALVDWVLRYRSCWLEQRRSARAGGERHLSSRD
jgi:hypothetical protein